MELVVTCLERGPPLCEELGPPVQARAGIVCSASVGLCRFTSGSGLPGRKGLAYGDRMDLQVATQKVVTRSPTGRCRRSFLARSPADTQPPISYSKPATGASVTSTANRAWRPHNSA